MSQTTCLSKYVHKENHCAKLNSMILSSSCSSMHLQILAKIKVRTLLLGPLKGQPYVKEFSYCSLV